jgi:hypothetical protein
MTPDWINAIAAIVAAVVSLVALVHSVFTAKRVTKLEKNNQSIGGAAVANTGNGVVYIRGQATGGGAQMNISKK